MMNGYYNSSNLTFGDGEEEDEHPFDITKRDLLDPDTLRRTKIVSAKGTVRGIKNRVRAGIARIGELENQRHDATKKVNSRVIHSTCDQTESTE